MKNDIPLTLIEDDDTPDGETHINATLSAFIVDDMPEEELLCLLNCIDNQLS